MGAQCACAGVSLSSRLRTSKGHRPPAFAMRAQQRHAARHAPTIPASCERCHKWMAGLPRIHACMHSRMHPPASPSLHVIAHWNLACESRHKWQHSHAAPDAPTHRRDRRAATQMQDAGARNQRACVELVQLRVDQWRRLVRPRLQNPVFRVQEYHVFCLAGAACTPRSFCSGHRRSRRAPRQLLLQSLQVRSAMPLQKRSWLPS